MTEPIRAAGVVLVRSGPGGSEVLVVHRPTRADWSLPKGKLEAGEHVATAAVRECEEETGYTPALGAPLETLAYSVDSRPKVVNYWRAHPRDDEGFAPDDEVDQIRWLDPDEARAVLTYPADRRLVTAAVAAPDTVPLVILRHTQAVKRSQFDGSDDAERPLTGKGRSQAKALVGVLDAYAIDRVHASTALRCQQTVSRFAKHLGTSTVPEPALAEEAHRHDLAGTAACAAGLALAPEPLVVCTHRPVLPTVLDAVAQALGIDPDDARWRRAWSPKLPPGGFIVVHRAFGLSDRPEVVAIEAHTSAQA